jgi:hypothetical protein
MIAEDLLERGLSGIASDYDVPVDAVDRIHEQLAPSFEEDDAPSWRDRLHAPTPRGWLMLAAAAIVVIVIASFAIGGTTSDNHVTTTQADRFDSPSADAGSGGGSVAGAPGATTPLRLPAHAPKAAPSVAALPARPLSGTGSSATTGSGTTAGGTTTLDRFGASKDQALMQVPAVPDKVIKTGDLDLQVPKGQVTNALNRLTGIATFERGYIADSRTSEGGGFPTGEITMRVPVATFDDAVKRARSIQITGIKVLGLQTSGKDVTSKFVDLKARIGALEKTRRTFLSILSRATTIGETLAVQQHITDVQTQIEQLKGQKKVLVNQAALSTLTVTVDQKVVPETVKTHHKSGLHKAFDRSVSRFVHGIEAIIGIVGPLLLAGLLIALFWFVGRFGYRALRRRMV